MVNAPGTPLVADPKLNAAAKGVDDFGERVRDWKRARYAKKPPTRVTARPLEGVRADEDLKAFSDQR